MATTLVSAPSTGAGYPEHLRSLVEDYLSNLRDPRDVLPLAGALELIHTFSLIHDDLPAGHGGPELAQIADLVYTRCS